MKYSLMPINIPKYTRMNTQGAFSFNSFKGSRLTIAHVHRCMDAMYKAKSEAFKVAEYSSYVMHVTFSTHKSMCGNELSMYHFPIYTRLYTIQRL